MLTSALDLDYSRRLKKYRYDGSIYEKRVYHGWGNAKPEEALVYGPNIADWPEQIALGKHLLMRVVSVLTDPVTTTDELIPSGETSSYRSNPLKLAEFTLSLTDPVTTTDELIPSGETSSYRSNPLKLAEFTLSRKDPSYVGRAKAVQKEERSRRETGVLPEEVLSALGAFRPEEGTVYGSVVVSNSPGDGSAREQAASCQRVLGGVANICRQYATKRYRSNLINWGMLPFTAEKFDLKVGDFVYIANVRDLLAGGETRFVAKVTSGGKTHDIALDLGSLTPDERTILLAGCLINYNRERN